jgi:hypothetical protein
MSFKEYDTYYASLDTQGSEEWHKLRYGRITMSNISACVGRSSYYYDKEDLARKICGLEKTQTNSYMEHGIITEPLIRSWYSEIIEKPIKEVGLAIWKNDYRFGGSLDGEINEEEGIEIKAPNKMYHKLIDYIESKKKGYAYPPGYHEHIFNSHYDQMIGNAVITGKKYMHYVVVCTDTQQAFIQKLPVDTELWEKELYPKACKFYDDYIEPIMKTNNITRMDPKF